MDLKSIAEAYQSVYEKKLDPVGKEDGDVDNDGDKDSSDSYLMKRRKAIAKAMKKEETEVAEHHQKDADGKVIEHDDTTPSSVEEEKTVLSKLTENGEELDMFDAVVAYLIDEGFAETLEEAQKIMSGLKPELVEEVYQSQLEKIQKSTPSEDDEVQQMDEFVGAALGALGGAALGKTALAKGLTTAAATKAAAIPGIGGAVSKALGSKIAPQVIGTAVGAGAGEALDPLKKTKDKDVVKAAAGGAVAPVVGSAIGGMMKNSYEPDKETDKEGKKIDNRVKGIQTAAKKMAKEEAVLEHHQKDADGKVIEHEDTTPSSVEEKTVLEQLAENNRDIDAFEAVVSYLIDEKLAESWEQAEKIMATLKPELVQEVYQNQLWTLFDESIEENRQVAMNPEKYKDPDESDKPYSQRSKAARMRDPKRGINSPAFKKFMADRGM